MSKQAQLADGTILDFPDETPQAIMDAAVQHHIATANLLAAQKAKYPTNAELGGKPGTAVQPDQVQGFLSEAAVNAKKLGAALSDTTAVSMPGAKDVLSQRPPTEGSTLQDFLQAAAPSNLEWNGLKSAVASSPVVKAASGGLNAVKQFFSPDVPLAQQIEQKIKPSGAYAKRITLDVSPELSKDFGLIAAKPGLPFDQALFNRYRAAGTAVRTVEGAIPDATPVGKQPILDGFDDLIKRYGDVGATDAVSALKRQQQILAELPVKPSTPPAPQASGLLDEFGKPFPAPPAEPAPPAQDLAWDQFNRIKQRFANDLKKTGVWRRLGTDAATEKDHALAQAYGNFMQAASEVSPDLAEANQKFSTLHNAVTSAGLDLDTGRRIANVGKAPDATAAMKVAKVAGKAAVTALGAKGVYDTYKSIVP